MADTQTPNLNLTRPEIDGSAETWGQKLNNDLTLLDTFAGTVQAFMATNDAHINALIAAIFPRGSIIAWSGSLAAIPPGWLLCNGTLGTPNLVDRFILGTAGTRPVGEAGGSFNLSTSTTSNGAHSHGAATQGHVLTVQELANHQHGGFTDTTGSHTHTYSAAFVGAPGGGVQGGSSATIGTVAGNITEVAGAHAHTFDTLPVGSNAAHSHGITSDGAHTHTLAGTLVQPYLALAYLMRA